MRTHQEIDARSLAFHRLVVERIRDKPSLFDQVKSTITRFQNICSPSAQAHLQEWANLIEAGVDRCLAMAVEDSEYAAAMRQSSPFAGIIPPREREELFRNWAKKHAA